MPVDLSEVRALAVAMRAERPRVRKGMTAVTRRHTLAAKATARQLVRVDSGDTQRSISARTRARGDDVVGTVSASTVAGIMLERGTARQPPYPFLGPALQREEPGYVSDMEKVAEQLLEAATFRGLVGSLAR